jgi:hypothetical protein
MVLKLQVLELRFIKVVQLVGLSYIEWENYICSKWFIDEG